MFYNLFLTKKQKMLKSFLQGFDIVVKEALKENNEILELTSNNDKTQFKLLRDIIISRALESYYLQKIDTYDDEMIKKVDDFSMVLNNAYDNAQRKYKVGKYKDL